MSSDEVPEKQIQIEKFLETCVAVIPTYHHFIQEVHGVLERLPSAQTDSLAVKSSIPKSINNKRILVVDDTEKNRILLSHYLKTLSIQLDFVNTAEEAMLKLQENYDLVLFCLKRKHENGIELLKNFRADLPIIEIAAPSASERDALISTVTNFLKI